MKIPASARAPVRNSFRRVPKQERSRDRIELILKVSLELIGRKGIDAVTVMEIAALSGGPIAVVYQYFPNKTAIIDVLYGRYAEEMRTFLAAHFDSIATANEGLEVIDSLFDLYYSHMRQQPSTQDLLIAVQADKALAGLDITETRHQAEMFYAATERFVAEGLRESYARTLFLIFHATGATVRLAMMLPENEAEQIGANFQSIVRVQATYFLMGGFPKSP